MTNRAPALTLRGGTARSRDGTRIAYRQVGSGPGLVVLHGTMSSAENHAELAGHLADAFTVTIPDRRGRGESGAYPADYGLRTEVEDLEAVLAATDSTNVLGVSSGAIIGLEAARGGSLIHRLVAFEPPLFEDPDVPDGVLVRFEAELDRGRLPRALAVAMKGAEMGPPILNRLPVGLVAGLTSLAMRQESRKPGNGYLPMATLGPLLRYDLRLVAEANRPADRFADVAIDLMLLGGSRSPAYLRRALDRLDRTLSGSRRVELPGLDHSATWDTNLRGNPRPVADAVRSFFAPTA
jgi:pimeloyl-ACP methyl ester carboxylesterase